MKTFMFLIQMLVTNVNRLDCKKKKSQHLTHIIRNAMIVLKFKVCTL